MKYLYFLEKKKQVSMIRKCHNHTAEESHNTERTRGVQYVMKTAQ